MGIAGVLQVDDPPMSSADNRHILKPVVYKVVLQISHSLVDSVLDVVIHLVYLE